MNNIHQKIKALLKIKQGDKFSAKKILILIFAAFVTLFLAGVVIFTILIAILSIGLPDVRDIDKLSVAQSTTIYDRDGNVLYVKHGDENRKYVPYEQISKHLVDATVTIEDDQFWTHSGFDIPGLVKAGLHEVFGVGAQRGGSTITQQYVKNAFLTNERSYTRKIKELILAVRLEQAYDKQTIIELYLNKIPYGNNAYGAQKAAEIYFDKDAKDLDIAESALLAGLPQAPSYYNPYGSNKYSELIVPIELLETKNLTDSSYLTKDVDYKMGLIGKGYQYANGKGIYIPGRADLILRKMFDDGYITKEEKDEAWSKLQNLEMEKHVDKIEAPHFVFYIIEQLEEKYGKEVVEQGGLQVYTTIDPDLQKIAETAIEEGAANNARFNATNAALVSIDPNNGQILAMVGSKDYYDEEIDGNVNIATSYRQPGSSFKPYVYAQAFYNRYSPGNIVYDVRTPFGGGDPPDNYDGAFHGPMTIRRALAQSRNIPAIKMYYLGGEQEPILNLAEKMGINFLTKDRDYGWPLALGTAEVTLLDHTSAYATFANGGKRVPPVSILKITNAQGEVLEEWDADKQEYEEVLDPQIAYLITSILSDLSVRLGPSITVPGQVNAAKTGTSNKVVNGINIPSNLWTMGYTTRLVTGVWAGNSDDRKSGNLSATSNGYEAAAPIFKNFMTQAVEVKGYSREEFPRPPGIQNVTVSASNGQLPGSNTPDGGVRSEIYASFGIPTEVDRSYTEVEVDKRNGLLANEWCPKEEVEKRSYQVHHSIDPTNEVWEAAVQAWAMGMASKEEGVNIGVPPTEYSPLCTKENLNAKRSIKIQDPANYSKVEAGNLNVSVKTQSDFEIESVTYYLDGSLQNTSRSAPYSGSLRISRFLEPGSTHTIRAVLTDARGYTAESTIEIRIKGDSSQQDEPTEGPTTIPEDYLPFESASPPEEPPAEDPQPVPDEPTV
jgi:membrane peptidoglycan carboxypeptidase